MSKATSVEEYRLISSFQSLRTTLLEERFADRLDKPLAFWALPNDRRLPLAFLGRTLKDLLDTPFEELFRTPGIGHKKITSLMKLLARAIKDDTIVAPPGVNDLLEASTPAPAKNGHAGGFDPMTVSEAHWLLWRDTVRRSGLGSEKLGRLANSLQSLPTVIWHTPLERYLNYSLTEIRQLKTHGEKRVRAILHIFWSLHEALSTAAGQGHLALRPVPQFILPVEAWISSLADRNDPPSRDEVSRSLTVPLLQQLTVDTGSTIARLAEGRLGVNAPPQSVRQQAKRMAVTRARVYQLLEECGNVMDVRWPEGKPLLRRLAERYADDKGEGAALLRATAELFYPDKSLNMEDQEDVEEPQLVESVN